MNSSEFDLESAMRPRQKQKRVNVDFPFGWWSSSIVKPPALEHRYLSAKLSACDAVRGNIFNINCFPLMAQQQAHE